MLLQSDCIIRGTRWRQQNFLSVTVSSYQREGILALAEAVRLAGMEGAWCMLEEGDWCMKPVKVENITSVVMWRETRNI